MKIKPTHTAIYPEVEEFFSIYLDGKELNIKNNKFISLDDAEARMKLLTKRSGSTFYSIGHKTTKFVFYYYEST